MKPIRFKQENKRLVTPRGLTDLNYGNISAYSDGRQCITLWRPSLRERLSILFFGRIWLSVFSGSTQPLIGVDGKRNMFPRPSFRVMVDLITDSIITKIKKLTNG